MNKVKKILLPLLLINVTTLGACDSNNTNQRTSNHSSEENNSEKNMMAESGAVVTVSKAKAKTTKAISEMETLSEDESNTDIKIVPNKEPYQDKIDEINQKAAELKKEQQRQDKKTDND